MVPHETDNTNCLSRKYSALNSLKKLATSVAGDQKPADQTARRPEYLSTSGISDTTEHNFLERLSIFGN